jgi:hypothetical protein
MSTKKGKKALFFFIIRPTIMYSEFIIIWYSTFQEKLKGYLFMYSIYEPICHGLGQVGFTLLIRARLKTE